MLTITVTSHNAKPMDKPLSAEFGESGGTIGRAPENTLALLDPDRKISRTHATISYQNGSYVLRDQGSVVPTLLNGKPLGNGSESPIGNGDELRISGYVLQVTGVARTAAAPTAAAASAPLVEAAPASVEPAPAMAAPVLSWSADAPSGAGQGFTTTVILTAAAADAAPAPEPPPSPAAATPAAAPVPAVPAAAAPAGDDELLRALLKGAGLRSDVTIPGGLTPELMHELGELLHEATRGLLDLLAARAQTKKQVRADMTVIVAKDNNPLKFAPSIEAALSHMLVPRGRGFMPPVRAVSDAYDDLRAHQQGFMEGMRSAMALVLARFDPGTLEHQLSKGSMVDSFMPGTRKAKLWDMFGQLYGEISKEAETDFHALFGQEFLKAYQAHVGKSSAPGAPAEH
jgi:type VI secretion system FHA domain protein